VAEFRKLGARARRKKKKKSPDLHIGKGKGAGVTGRKEAVEKSQVSWEGCGTFQWARGGEGASCAKIVNLKRVGEILRL